MIKKVLIIEDDIFLGGVIAKKLSENGFETKLSSDGAEGFGEIKSWKPDLVLVDVILPSMNGYEILEAKAKDPDIMNIPVIVVSNSGQPVEIKRVMALGAKDYLIKTQFNPEEILTKIKNISSELSGEPKSSNVEGSSSLTGVTILWVEDDSFLFSLISRKFSNTGCTMIHAQKGEEALKILSEGTRPDIILLDIMLPGISGYDILENIKSQKDLENIPVVLLSNLGQREDIEKGKKLKADAFIIKATVSIDQIMKTIKDILNSKKTK